MYNLHYISKLKLSYLFTEKTKQIHTIFLKRLKLYLFPNRGYISRHLYYISLPRLANAVGIKTRPEGEQQKNILFPPVSHVYITSDFM